MFNDILRIAMRDGLIWLPIILGFGLLYSRLRHIDVSLDGVVVLSGITAALVWNATNNYLASISASIVCGAVLSVICANLNSLLGIPPLMIGIIFSLTAHSISVIWVGESVRVRRTELIVGQQIPWWLPMIAAVVLLASASVYRTRGGILVRKLGDGVKVNTIWSSHALQSYAYGLSGTLYGLGAGLYVHKIGSARAGGGFEFLVVSVCAYLSVYRICALMRAALAGVEKQHSGGNPVVLRWSEFVVSPEVSALAGSFFYATLVPVVLTVSPSPTTWKLVLAGFLIAVLFDYSSLRHLRKLLPRRRLPSSVPELLEGKSIGFAYSNGPIFRPVFQDAKFAFERGLTLVKGANGTGKSTLLRIISGEIESYTGVITLDRHDLDALPGHRRPVYFVTQNPFLTIGESLTVNESISTAVLDRSSKSPQEIRRRLQDCLKQIGLSPDVEGRAFNPYADAFWAQRVSNLSGGQAAIIAILSALASEQPVLTLDEPSTGLDQFHFGLLVEMLQLAARTRVVIVSSHDERLDRVADRVVVVGDGRIQPLA